MLRRNFFITVITVSLLLLHTSCDSMLDLFPHSSVATDNLTEEDADLLLTGLYYYTQNKPTVNGYITQDILGGNFIRGGASGYATYQILLNDLITPESGFVSDPWNGYYTNLYQINEFITSVEKMTDSDKKNSLLGVAHFFRGLVYYNLVTRWGAVPLIKVPTTEDVAASPETEIWEFVEEEFGKAIQFCPQFSSNEYVSKEAAKALMARVKLATGKKTEAATLAEEVITSGFFGLDQFEKIFRRTANNEIIFAFTNLPEESSIRTSTFFYTRDSSVGGSYTYAPTNDVMNMFDPNDKRKDISVAVQATNNVLNKYPSGETSTDPIIITRLAEMYLISAEAKGLSNGLGRLNELRAFRGLAPVNPANESEFIDAILQERHLEFLGEGFRWFDLVRTGRLETKLNLDSKFNKLPVPSREMELNKLLEQNSYWKSAE